ncbi:MAG: hypothetical protein M1342_01535 [Patescibacteria group bacterium]|nr:hypothetical protein [Patescibacteria group bacterium]
MQNKPRKKILVSIVALALIVLGGSAYAMNHTGVVQKAHAQEPTIQTQSTKNSGQQIEVKDSSVSEPPESTTEKETADGPGGHQDAAGANVNHQFEGVE